MASVKNAAKLEKMLYSAYLDNAYAANDFGVMVAECAGLLKEYKKNLKKAIKNRDLARKQYVEVYGNEPMKPREF